ncbi:MAG TPA: AAA family ATPase [Jiangellales bacterium]|nr:AAA family ATPase [Jiangellales bacterium]
MAQFGAVDGDTFVGREPELADLDRRLASAREGNGGVVLVEADPGMGKTALAYELTRRARRYGLATAWGACLEGEGAPAYRPWIQVLADVGRPTMTLTDPAITDDGGSRFRLFDEVVTALREASARDGMLIVLDDLHWADVPSIRLLQVVVSEVASCRLLVVGLYRSAAVYAHAEVTVLLRAILRERTAGRVTLRGLSDGEVAQLAAHTLRRVPDDALLRGVTERAEGNPLFVLEVLRLLGTPGQASRRVPQSVREVIEHRFARVPAATRRTMRQASVLGREFSVGLLAVVAQQPPAQILDLLDDAMAAELVAGEGHSLRFAHALMQEVAYSELPSAERQQLHQRAALAIHAGGVEPVDALAYHLRQAAPLGGAQDAQEALQATLEAARRARGQLAYEHAAFQYREALALLPLLTEGPVRRQDLLLDLARCEFRSGAVTEAWASCRAAADLGRAAGEGATVADAATVVRGLTHSQMCEEIHEMCREALAMLQGAEPVRVARLLGQLAVTASPWAGDVDSSISQEALRAAEATGDPDARFLALQARQTDLTNVRHVLERLAIGERAVLLGRETGRDEYLAWGHVWRMDAFSGLGRRLQLDAELTAFTGVVGHMKEPLWIWRLKAIRASLAAMEGRFGDARALAEEALVIGTRGGNQMADFLHLVFTAHLAVETGTGLDVVELGVRRFVEHGPFLARCWLANILAASGRLDEAKALWDSVVPYLDSFPEHAPEWLVGACGNADLCVRFNDRKVAPRLYADLLPFADRHAKARADTPYEGPVALFLGKLARLLGDREAAATHLRAALRSSAAMGSPPYEAKTHLEIAHLMLDRRGPSDLRDAETHLETARRIACRTGMAPVETDATTILHEHRRGRATPLSPREEQVAALVAEGFSNRQIASRLHIAERTAENHVQNILNRLGFDSRARIASWFAGRSRDR